MNAKHISLAFAAITIASLIAGCAKSPVEEGLLRLVLYVVEPISLLLLPM